MVYSMAAMTEVTMVDNSVKTTVGQMAHWRVVHWASKMVDRKASKTVVRMAMKMAVKKVDMMALRKAAW